MVHRSLAFLYAALAVILAAKPCLAFQITRALPIGPSTQTRASSYSTALRMSTRRSPVQEPSCTHILTTYEPREYRAPFWARNQHVNTIIGALFATPPKPEYRRERWSTPDGDFVDVDWLYSRANFTRGIVLLYHGLESTTNAPLTVRQAFALAEQGFDVGAVCFRGCSGEDNLTPGAYHLGFTDDIRYIAKTLHERSPETKIFLSGTSLGWRPFLSLDAWCLYEAPRCRL